MKSSAIDRAHVRSVGFPPGAVAEGTEARSCASSSFTWASSLLPGVLGGASRGPKAIMALARMREKPITTAGFVLLSILSAAELTAHRPGRDRNQPTPSKVSNEKQFT